MKEIKYCTANSLFFPPWDFILSIFFHTTKAEGKKGARTYLFSGVSSNMSVLQIKEFFKDKTNQNLFVWLVFYLELLFLHHLVGYVASTYICLTILVSKPCCFPRAYCFWKKTVGLWHDVERKNQIFSWFYSFCTKALTWIHTFSLGARICHYSMTSCSIT